MLKSFTEGINLKSAVVSIVVMFIYIFLTDWILHGMVMGPLYAETAQAWRPESEMVMWSMVIGQLLIAKYFTLIFIHGYKGQGLMEGVRYGLYIGFFVVGTNFISYAVQPITVQVLIYWIFGGLLQSVGGGALLTFVYKR